MRYRYRNDEEMKDSGVEWIGKIPKDWSRAKIGHICEIGRGRVISSEEILDNKGIYPVYSSQTKDNGVMGYIDTFDFEGDYVTLTTDGANAGTVFKRSGKFNCTNVCGTLKNRKKDLDLSYLAYALSIETKPFVRLDINPKLMNNEMSNINICITGLIEQEKIANFLDEKTSQFDLIISKKEELIKKLEEAKKSLISEVVTGKVKVVKTDDGYEIVKRKKDEMKDSGIEWLGEIPKEWEIYRSKYLWKKEKRPILDNYDVVTAFRDGEVTLRTNRRTEGYTFAIKETGYQGVLKGDLVISAMDAFAGAMGISDSEGKCSPVYSVCSPIKKLVPDYYKYLLKEMSQKGYILSLAKGIRERSTDFRYSEFANTTLLYPNFNEQEIISSYINIKLNNIDEFKTKLKCQIEKLKEAKQSLISEAVTGKIEILD